MSERDYIDDWIAATTAFDRVYSIAAALDEPTKAASIADDAHVAENTARDHLSRLVDLGVLQSGQHDGVEVFYPDPLYTRMRALRELLDNYDLDGLLDQRATLQEDIERWRETYGVETADELRQRAAHAESAEETREYKKTASDWDYIKYRLSVVSEAIEHYEAYTQSPLDGSEANETQSLPSGAWTGMPGDEFWEYIGEEMEAALAEASEDEG